MTYSVRKFEFRNKIPNLCYENTSQKSSATTTFYMCYMVASPYNIMVQKDFRTYLKLSVPNVTLP